MDTSSAHMTAELVDRLAAELVKVPARAWREMFGDLLRYDDTGELAAITAEALLIWGDADALVGEEMQDELVRQLPRAELVVYPGIGHTPRWEDPRRFAEDVAGFVSR